jgi:methylated-DNA-[protein]-cysteine S-methyltransferase
MVHFYTVVLSPVGLLKLVASNDAPTAVLWEDDDPKRVSLGTLVERRDHSILRRAEQQLRESFAGERRTFDIDLDFMGTEFQKKVWNAVLAIPYGETRSYKEVANAVGNAKAVRAVGAASGRNPMSIIAPCHRVVGTDGSLTGFAGGIETKRYLLAHETGAGAAWGNLAA